MPNSQSKTQPIFPFSELRIKPPFQRVARYVSKNVPSRNLYPGELGSPAGDGKEPRACLLYPTANPNFLIIKMLSSRFELSSCPDITKNQESVDRRHSSYLLVLAIVPTADKLSSKYLPADVTGLQATKISLWVRHRTKQAAKNEEKKNLSFSIALEKSTMTVAKDRPNDR
jgi:hypothetical protein